MQSTFEFCFKTTVADFYDISVLVNGSPIASSPCYACAHIIPLGVNSAEVQDLPSVVVAGSDVHFGVVLYDIYKNVISPSAAVSVEFYPNPHKYIIADDLNPDTNRYNFVLNVNHTETFTISLYINGHLFEGHNYTIEVIASTPSSNSILSFVSNELQLVKNQEFVLDVKLQSSRGVSVPANQYAIAIRLTNSLTLHPFYNFGYSCYLLSQEENGYAEMIYRCFVKIHEAIKCVLRVYIGSLDPYSTKTGTIPDATQYGPKVLLINKYSASDGDLFPWSFKANNIGTIIGTRSWGGIIGISGSLPYMDGTDIRVPFFTNYDAKTGEWIIENHGVDPDILIDNNPIKEQEGEDEQLNKAIEVILEQLKDRKPLPKVPAPRTFKDLHLSN